MGTLHRLFYGVFYQIRWFVSFPVFGGRDAGCGVRGGGGLMAADYLWGLCTGGCEIPVQVVTVRPLKFGDDLEAARRQQKAALFYMFPIKILNI